MTDLRGRLVELERNPVPDVWRRVERGETPTSVDVDTGDRRRWAAMAVAVIVAIAALGFAFTALRPTSNRPAGGGLSGTLTYYVMPLSAEGEVRTLDLATGVDRATGMGDPEGSLSPDGSRILRLDQGRGRTTLTVVDTQTESELVSLRIDGVVLAAAWRPDGSEVAFAGQTEATAEEQMPFLRIVDLSGTVRAVDVPGWWDAIGWAPDASTFALLGRDASDRHGLYVAPVQGGTAAFLAADDGFDRSALSWSPDSSTIAVAEDEVRGERLPTDITLISADGSDIRSLGEANVTESAPLWSPDGRWITFMSDRDAPSTSTYDGSGLPQGFGLYVMRPDGTDLRRVIPPRDDVGWFAPISWTP
jgi:Tol biopolymer transport system component